DHTMKDVTPTTFFASSDPDVGTFSGATFTWGGAHGGKVDVTAKECGVVGMASIALQMDAIFGSGGGGGVDGGADGGGGAGDGGVDPNAANMQFMNAPSSSVAACKPTLVYPPDGVLLPPNTNVVEVHFLEGMNNNLFEVSFTNSVTDVRVFTKCAGTT